MSENYKTIVNFSNDEIKELQQFFNSTPVEFNSFLSMILKALLFEMYHKAKDERERKNHYSFTLDDETDLKLQKIIQNWERLKNKPLNINYIIKSLVNKEYVRYLRAYEKERIIKLKEV